MNDDQKALLITLALAALETVRLDEVPKSKRYYKMDKAISHLVYLTNTYRLDAWPAHLVTRASNLLDEFNARIEEEFGGTLRTRASVAGEETGTDPTTTEGGV